MNIIKENKDRILLINLPLAPVHSYKNKGAIYPGTALLLLGSILKSKGWKVDLIDGAFEENYQNLIAELLKKNERKYVFAGMSAMTTQIPHALHTARNIRKISSKLPIVLGGTHGTLFPQQTAASHEIDIVVVNEGTKAVIRLTEALAKSEPYHTIPGLCFRSKEGEIIYSGDGEPDDIGDFPELDFSLIKLDHYLKSSKSVYQREFPNYVGDFHPIPILTALGCPYRCKFCINVILKRTYRYLEAKEIIRRIKYMQTELGANTFIFLDEDFFINRNRVFEFVELAEKEKLHFNWRMWCRVDHFKPGFIERPLLERLTAIGHGSLVMGGESANQEILDSLQKGTTPGQILHSLRELDGLPINPRYSFIAGLENESLEQIRQTYEFTLKLQDIRHDVDIAGPFLFRLYPGSPIYDNLTRQHNLGIPENLEDWEDFLLKDNNNYTERPWVPESFLKNIEKINFYYYWAMMRYHKWNGLPKQIIGNVLCRIAASRIKKFSFKFPWEYWLMNR